MTYPEGQAEQTDHPILRAAIAMAPKIQAAGEEIEEGRRIPKAIAEALKGVGIFGMATPSCMGWPGTRPANTVPPHRGPGHKASKGHHY